MYLIEHKKRPPLLEFNEIGRTQVFKSTDRLVIGMRGPLYQLSDIEWHREPLTSFGLKVDLLTNLRTGLRILDCRAVYGEEVAQVLSLFYKMGIRLFTYVGTTGSLDHSLQVGDIVIPETLVLGPHSNLKFENRVAGVAMPDGLVERVKLGVRQGWAQTLLKENRSYIRRAQKMGVQSLDIETKYLVEFLRNKPKARVQTVLVVSDEVTGAQTYDQYISNLSKITTILRALRDGIIYQKR